MARASAALNAMNRSVPLADHVLRAAVLPCLRVASIALVCMASAAVAALAQERPAPETPVPEVPAPAPAPLASPIPPDKGDPEDSAWSPEHRSTGNDVLFELIGSEAQHASFEISRDKDGSAVGVFPSPIRIDYAAAKLLFFADSAVVWVTPRDTGKATAESAQNMFQDNIGRLEVYAEGNIWLRYGEGTAATTLRADRVYLDLSRGELSTFTLRGKADAPRAHSSPGAIEEVTDDHDSAKPAEFQLGALRGAKQGAGASAARGSGSTDPAAAAGVKVEAQERDVFELEKNQRIFMRAKTMRIIELQSSRDGRKIVELEDGVVSHSSLAVPNVGFKADIARVDIRPLRRIVTLSRPGLAIRDVTLLTYPDDDYTYDLDSKFPITRFDLSTSAAFGFSLFTKFDAIAAYDFLWDPQPTFRPLSASPIFDYYSQRGIGTGAELGLGRDGAAGSWLTGWWQGYYIRDNGDQRDVARDLGFFPLERKDRGRMKGWARAKTPWDLQIDGNLNYQSDRNFIEEFFRREFDANEELRSFVFARKDHANRTWWLDTSIRTRGFVDEVEKLPELGFATYREPVGPAGAGVQLTAIGTFGGYRMRTRRESRFDGWHMLRGDMQVMVNRPLDFGVVTVDPYTGLRVTGSDSRQRSSHDSNPLYDPFTGFTPPREYIHAERALTIRPQWLAGVAAQTTLSRTFAGVDSRTLDLRGLRHVMTPQVRWDNVAGPRYRSHDFFQIDQVAAASNEQVTTFSLRNRLQTRRTLRDKDGWTAQTVDWIDTLIEVPLYPNRNRDNDGQYLGDVELGLGLAPLRNLALRGGVFLDARSADWQRSWASAALTVGETQWAAYYRGVTGLHSIFGASVAANLSETYSVDLRQEYDVRLGRARDTYLRISRSIVESIFVNLTFRRDAVTRDYSISLSLSAKFSPPDVGRAFGE